ncbi:BspA family leucine-rich repeat surface protein [Companilactobacillus ginsenosidimutans]|uniref:Surface layer protein A domain-containing protein n=1 Tax=Companilactobacillus ginsenosidimutans TaxID=1007676 RepID=A0A0H4QMB1_9LACO|nr:BspA family leucine-rich repeat surface protein [Companilactobacillus ginsenosidimutans]AKP67848.1 hypothetical protein ABM34_10110 [Companilactobacillus ginsenosidimutans]
MTSKKSSSNMHHQKMAHRTTKIAAIAGLTMTCGMILSEISPVVFGEQRVSAAEGTPVTHTQKPTSTVPAPSGEKGPTPETPATPETPDTNDLKPDGTTLSITSADQFNDFKNIDTSTDHSFDNIETITFSGDSDYQVSDDQAMATLFNRFKKLTTVNGIDKLDIRALTTLNNAFNKTQIKELDFSNLNISDKTIDSLLAIPTLEKITLPGNTNLKDSISKTTAAGDTWIKMDSKHPDMPAYGQKIDDNFSMPSNSITINKFPGNYWKTDLKLAISVDGSDSPLNITVYNILVKNGVPNTIMLPESPDPKYSRTSESTKINIPNDYTTGKSVSIDRTDLYQLNNQPVEPANPLKLTNGDTLRITPENYSKENVTSFKEKSEVKHLIFDNDIELTGNISRLFSGFNNLIDFNGSSDVLNVKTSNITNMDNLFAGTKISSLDMSSWDLSKLESANNMFSNTGLVKLVVSSTQPLSKLSLPSSDKSTWFKYNKEMNTTDDFTNADIISDTDLTSLTPAKSASDKTYFQMKSGKYANSPVTLNVTKDGQGNSSISLGRILRQSGDTKKSFDLSKLDVNYIFTPNNVNLTFNDLTSNPVTDQPVSCISKDKLIVLSDGTLHVTSSNFKEFSKNQLDASQKSKVQTIVMDKDIKLSENLSRLFHGYTNLTKIEGLSDLDTSNVTNMDYMFQGDVSLENLDVSHFDVRNVITFQQMFEGTSIKELNLENWKFKENSNTNVNLFLADNALEKLTLPGNKNLLNGELTRTGLPDILDGKKISFIQDAIPGTQNYQGKLALENTLLKSKETATTFYRVPGEFHTRALNVLIKVKGRNDSVQASTQDMYTVSPNQSITVPAPKIKGYHAMDNLNTVLNVGSNLDSEISLTSPIYTKDSNNSNDLVVVNGNLSLTPDNFNVDNIKKFSQSTDVHTISIDPEIKLSDISNDLTDLFSSYNKLEKITGLNKLDVSNVQHMDRMFKNTKVKSLDIQDWLFNENVTTDNMFQNSSINDLKLKKGTKLSNVNLPTGESTDSEKSTWFEGKDNKPENNKILGSDTLINIVPTQTDNSDNFDEYQLVPGEFKNNDITVNIVKDGKSDTIAVKSIFRKIGDSFEIKVPDKPDFVANQQTITLTDDGSNKALTPKNELVYTPEAKVLINKGNKTDITAKNFNSQSIINFSKGNGQTVEEIHIKGPEKITVSGTDLANLFSGFTHLKVIDGLQYLDTSKATDMSNMFAGTALESIDLSNLDTSNVTSTANMFKDTPELTNIIFAPAPITTNDKEKEQTNPVANKVAWNLNKVTSVQGMFENSGIKDLDLSSWTLPVNQPTADGMFLKTALTRLTLPKNVKLSKTGLTPTEGHTWLLDDAQKGGNDAYSTIVADGNLDSTTGTTLNLKKGVYESHKLDLIAAFDGNSKPFTTGLSYTFVPGNTITVDKPHVDGYYQPKGEIEIPTNKTGIPAAVDVHDKLSYESIPVPEQPDTGNQGNNNSGSSSTSTGSTTTDNSNHNWLNLPDFPDFHFNTHHEFKPVTTIVKAIRKISTHVRKTAIKLYNSALKLIKNRSLSPNTPWFSDKEMTKDGIKYFRVSTNEWVRANDVYEYAEHLVTITTKGGTPKQLVNSLGKTIVNRSLSKNSAWRSDRTITLNGKLYHRVSTDEFVADDDVTIK